MSAVTASREPVTEFGRRELEAVQDATRLAELWEHALQASFRFGYQQGHQVGWLAGRDEEATAWQAIVTGYSAVLAAPARAELARLRAPSNDPCSRRCDACSQCTRAAAVAANLTHYGRPDFPGRGARTETEEGPS